MKKQYSKPGIFIEEFQLSQNISTACGVPGGGSSLGRPKYADPMSCAWEVGDVLVFTNSVGTKCDWKLDEGEDYEGVCYNNPTSGNNVFASY